MDFKATYDSICGTKLYEAMTKFQILNYLVTLVHYLWRKCNVEYKQKTIFQKYLKLIMDLVKGMRSYALIVFNIALEKVKRQTHLSTTRTVYTKFTQILAYADVDLISKAKKGAKDALIVLKNAAIEMELVINIGKIKYMSLWDRPDIIDAKIYK